MSNSPPSCDRCGRFVGPRSSHAWKLIYSGYPPTPDKEIFRCALCVLEYGTFEPQDGIKSEFSCGVIHPGELKL